jgi:hypothetical protein
MSPGTAQFTSRYKQIAKTQGTAFEKAQSDYIARTHYDEVAKYAAKKGIDIRQRGIQEALFSESVQHGPKGNRWIIDHAAKKANLKDPESVIRELYNARSNYVDSLSGVSNAAGRDRYRSEVNDAIAVQRSQGRGSALNNQSTQQSAKPPVIIVNNNGMKSTPQKTPSQPKPRVPPPRSDSWSDWAKRYFSI